MTDEINKKKNDNIKFKQKKKKSISFEIITTTKEKKMMMKKKASVENNDFHIFEISNVKNSTERISAKFVIDNIMLFSNIFKVLSFDFEKFSK